MGVKGQPWVENTDSHSDKEAILFLKTEAFPIIVVAISILYRKTTHTHTHRGKESKYSIYSVLWDKTINRPSVFQISIYISTNV